MNTPSPAPRFTASVTTCVERGNKKFFRGANASSALSLDDARHQARALARSRAEAAADGRPPLTPEGAYPYPERILVEPLIERLSLPATAADTASAADAPRSDSIGTAPCEIARLTRNSYEATVLNAYRVMFVDVDTAADTSNAKAEKPVPQSEALDALAALVQARSELQFRVYATKAGLRYLCTSRLFDPVSVESQDILRLLRADPRYALLCRVQKCYRARLSPKTWRCLVQNKPLGLLARLLRPSRDQIDPARFATCRYLETVGNAPAIIPPEIALIIQKHDALCEVSSAKPLA